MLYNNISCLSYRIYVNKQGWELVAISKKPYDAVIIVEELVKNDHHALVVTHDFDIDADIDVHTINSDEKLASFKQQLLKLPENITENHKKLTKINKKQ